MNQRGSKVCTLDICDRLLYVVLLSFRRFSVSTAPLIPTDQEAVTLSAYLFCLALWTVKSRDFLKSSHASQVPDHRIPASGSLGTDSRNFCFMKFSKWLCAWHHCSQLFLLSSRGASNTEFIPRSSWLDLLNSSHASGLMCTKLRDKAFSHNYAGKIARRVTYFCGCLVLLSVVPKW